MGVLFYGVFFSDFIKIRFFIFLIFTKFLLKNELFI